MGSGYQRRLRPRWLRERLPDDSGRGFLAVPAVDADLGPVIVVDLVHDCGRLRVRLNRRRLRPTGKFGRGLKG